MPNCDKLLVRAHKAPHNVRFTDLCELAICYGFVLRRTKGSHHIFKRDGYHKLLNFQDDSGKAKAYQVKQLLEAIDDIEASNTEEQNNDEV